MSTRTRQLGLGSAIGMVVGNMVGTGVFTTSGLLQKEVGSPALVMLTWVLGGLIALLGVACYIPLARLIPESGGEYIYLSRLLHPAAGYLAGWVIVLVGFAVPTGALAAVFGQYLGGCFPSWAPAPRISGTLAVLATTVIHCISSRGGARTQAVAVVAELLGMAIFAALGLGHLTSHHVPVPSAPAHWGGLGLALIMVSYSYTGWNSSVYVAGEVVNHERNLPRSLWLGTGVVTVLYIALNAAFVWAVPPAQLAGEIEVARLAALAVGGPHLSFAVAGLITLIIAVCISALTMGGSRVIARMAQDGCLPRALIATPGRPPRLSILVQSLVALIALWTATYDSLLTYVGISLGLMTAATVVGLIRARLREGAQLHVPGWPWVPVLFLTFVFSSIAAAVWQRPVESGVGLATLLAGLVAYRWQRTRGRSSLQGGTQTETGERALGSE
jgi:APA family basic amino acid/polyamine antiporter